ncbi:MAG: adenosine deaminase, partial [Acidimicrobiales bacterium]
ARAAVEADPDTASLHRRLADLDELRSRYRFADLQGFLDLYYENLSVLRTEADFHEVAVEYLDRARAANVRRAEIFFDPQSHLTRGVPLEVIMDGIGAALADSERTHGISTALISCFMRNLGADAAHETLTALLPFRDRFIGIGLDSTEIGFPATMFADVYARAAAEGLHLVAHAGEEGGPETVTETLDQLHVERIDHGIRSMEDPEVVARLRAEGTPLTVCPLSNVCLRAVDTLASHPLPAMLAAGIVVSVNSDDPAYFGGYVDDNYRAIGTELGITGEQQRTLARSSFDAAFITADERARWQGDVDAFYDSPATR